MQEKPSGHYEKFSVTSVPGLTYISIFLLV